MSTETRTLDTVVPGGHTITGGLDVVIVSYNTRELLLQCLESIYRAEWPAELQVWVVDNDSADGSLEAARERFPQCTAIAAGGNLGFSKGNNLAIRQTTGKYLLLLNPDTVVSEDCFVRMAEYLDDHPDVGLITCKLITGDGSLDLACRRSFPTIWDGFCRASGLSALFPTSRLFARYNMTYLDIDEINEVECVNGAFMFAKREAVEQVGPLDEDYFIYIEDIDWCYCFRKAGWKIVYNPSSVTVHLKGQASAVRSERMIRELFKSQELFYRKHYFPRKSWYWQGAAIASLRLWMRYTLVRNWFRKRKRVRP